VAQAQVKELRMTSNTSSTIGVIALAVVMALQAALAGCTRDYQKYEVRTLPSGRVIRVQPEWKQFVPHEPAELMLNYETRLKIANKVALREEVDEIWESFFKKDAEKGQFKRAAIVAQETPESRFVLLSDLYRFTYDQQPDGNWVRSEDQKN
jgi:hypothetical protein